MVLTSTLKTQIRSDIKDALEVLFTYGAIGTDNTTPTESDTALGTEVFRDAIDDFDKSAADKVVASLRVLPTEANGNDIKEGGWFNASSSGTMWTRNTLNTITKTSDIQIYFDVEITIEVTEG